jgi:hypothetical protein
MISDDQLSAALTYLAESAEPLGRAVGKKVGFEEKAHIEREQAFLNAGEAAPESTMREREARAKTSEPYKAALREYVAACQEEATIRAKRVHAEALVECWRSFNASKRAANV